MISKRGILIGFVTVLAATARAQDLFAQQSMPVIGVLVHGTELGFKTNAKSFIEGLAKGGIQVGSNATISTAYTNGQADRIAPLAAELVSRNVALIATTGDAPTQAAKRATTIVPVVFSVGSDPVAQGLVASLNRPGANLTGVTNLNVELGPKRVEVLHEVLPRSGRIALLVNPASSFTENAIRASRSAAERFSRDLIIVQARTGEEIETTFASLRELGIAGIAISADSFFNNNSARLAALSLRYRIPAIYSNRDFSGAGGLVSYGTDLHDLFRQQGIYAARVLKGELTATLPVHQAARIEMIVNMKTADLLGITVPQHLLARADEVIE